MCTIYFGLIFWAAAIGAAALFVLCSWRRGVAFARCRRESEITNRRMSSLIRQICEIGDMRPGDTAAKRPQEGNEL